MLEAAAPQAERKELMRWRITYKGAPEPDHSASGHAAPSWATFDRRVWECDGFKLTLTNLGWNEGTSRTRVRQAPRFKIAEYQVVIEGPLFKKVMKDTDWLRLVRAAKQLVETR